MKTVSPETLMLPLLLPLLLLGTATLFSLGVCSGQERIDWSRARTLRQKEARGERLTPDEQSYLNQAKRALAERGGKDAGIRGDGAGEMVFIAPIQIGDEAAPSGRIQAKTKDGMTAVATYRKPAGEGPYPAVVFIHGGLTELPEQNLTRQLRFNPVYTRMLAAGYVIVVGTFRTYDQDVQSQGPILDSLAVVEAVKELPFVDSQSVVVFGGSGGGSIALELAGLTDLAAAVCGEPATILYTGMLTTGEYGPRLKIMANPHEYFTPEIKERTRKKLKTIRCPVLILHGDIHDLKTMNGEIMLPEMKAAGVNLTYKVYPGNPHGFYTGNHASKETVVKVVNDVRTFIKPLLNVHPSPLELT